MWFTRIKVRFILDQSQVYLGLKCVLLGLKEGSSWFKVRFILDISEVDLGLKRGLLGLK